MITLLFLLLIALYIFLKNYKDTGFYPLLSIIFPQLLFLVFIIEVDYRPIEYIVSDEYKYFHGIMDQVHVIDRFFWYALNHLLTNYDILGVLSTKLINIPILFFTLYMLWSMFNYDKRIFLVVLILPYISLLATKNLRDIFILFLIVSIFFTYYKLNKKWLVFIPLFLIFTTRPFIGFIILFLIIMDHLIKEKRLQSIKISIIKPELKIKPILIRKISIIAIFIVLFLSIPHINERLSSYYRYLSHYTIKDGFQERQESREGLGTGNYFKDYGYGAFRYALTPIPTSLINRLLKGGSGDWGFVDDIVRIFNQIFYYLLLLYVILNYKSIYNKFRELKPETKLLIITLLLYLPLYTFYGFGVGHQRVKIPFQLAFFLLFIINKKIKRNTTENV